MWYVIADYDGDDVLAKRLATRDAHLARLQDSGQLFVASSCPAINSEESRAAGFSDSVIIAEFVLMDDEAWFWAKSDPYLADDVYTRVKIRPFQRMLP